MSNPISGASTNIDAYNQFIQTILKDNPKSHPILRYADSITTCSSKDGTKTLSFSENEPIESRVVKYEQFLEKTSDVAAKTPQKAPKPDYKLKEKEPVKDHKIRAVAFGEFQKESLEIQFGKNAVACMRIIVEDNYSRNPGYLDADDFTLLNKGMFYGNEYFSILSDLIEWELPDRVKLPIQQRLELFIRNGNFYHGKAPSKYFKYESDPSSPTGVAMLKYVLRSRDITPSAALNAIIKDKELIFLECATASQLAFYHALQIILGPKFDELFSYDSPMPFSISSGRRFDNPILHLVETVPFSKEALSLGSVVFFQGPSIYNDKHFNGEGANWNVMCSNPTKQLYLGFGLKPKGYTVKGIEKVLLDSYNADPVGIKGMDKQSGENLIATLPGTAAHDVYKNHKISLAELRKYGGGKAIIINRPYIKRIQLLADSPVKQGLLFLNQWKMQAAGKLPAVDKT